MNFWDLITGNDMDRELAAMKRQVAALPQDYQQAWETLTAQLWQGSSFTGRNLMPIMAELVDLLTETAGVGMSVEEALGADLPAFAADLLAAAGAATPQDRWRQQLNRAVHKQLGR